MKKCEHCIIANDDTDGIAYCDCNGDLPDRDDWRDVREELPDKMQYVFVLTDSGNRWIAYLSESGRFQYTLSADHLFEFGLTSIETVTHWQPLPPPPSSGKGGE